VQVIRYLLLTLVVFVIRFGLLLSYTVIKATFVANYQYFNILYVVFALPFAAFLASVMLC
jgi:hypothetical protein